MLFVQDSRIALRLFRRTPLATGVALASFALSVGAASVVYAAIKSADAAIVNDFFAKHLWPGQKRHWPTRVRLLHIRESKQVETRNWRSFKRKAYRLE